MSCNFISRSGFLRSFLIAFFLIVFQSFAQETRPKYIFLMIGDGMSVPQISAAAKYRELTQPDAPGFILNSFPVKGLTTTHPVISTKTTDSAAAATAIACGVKTANGMIGMTPDMKSHRSVAYAAKEKGKKVAIISSVGINHATPACFYSTRMNRGMYIEIGSDIAKSGFDFFAGEPLLGKDTEKTRELIKAAGYTIITDKDKIMNFKSGDKVLLQHSIPYRVDKKDDSLRLADFVRAGLKSVGDAEKGFFCMIEAGKIDWTGHANDLASNIGEILDLNDAMTVVYEFYKKHPQETLIVVTGDHETGGMSFSFSGDFDPKRFVAAVDGQKKSAGAIGGMFKQWKKDGLSSEEVVTRCLAQFGLDDVSSDERKKLMDIAETLLKSKKTDKRSKELRKMYGGRNALLIACQAMLAQRCGVTWTTFGHSSAKVKTAAIGPGSERFAGETDNTDIAKGLFELMD